MNKTWHITEPQELHGISKAKVPTFHPKVANLCQFGIHDQKIMNWNLPLILVPQRHKTGDKN